MNQGGLDRQQFAAFFGRCVDCNADSELVDLGGGVSVVRLRHETSCPSYRRHRGRRSA